MKRLEIKNLIKNHKKAVVIISCIAVLGSGIVIVKANINKSDNKAVQYNNYEETVRVEKGDLVKSITVTGKIKSAEVSNVSTALTHKVKSVNVKVGDYVKDGDVICVLDDSDILKEIEAKNKEIAENKQRLQENYNKLVNQLNSLKNAKAAAVSAQDSIVSTAEATLSIANNELNNYQGTFDSAKNTYNIMLNSISDKQKAYDDAENNKKNSYEAWLKSGGGIESQEYKNYKQADENLTAKLDELEKAKTLYDYDNVSSKYNEVLGVYNSKLATIDSIKAQYNEALLNRKNIINSNNLEIDNIKASIDGAYNELKKADDNEELKLLQDKLNKTVLKAESNGKITELKVNVGSVPDGLIATIQDTNKLILSVNIPEYDINKIKIDMKASIISDTLNEKLNGKVTGISPVAGEGENSGFSADILIDNAEGVFIGTSAKAEIIISEKKNVLIVPIDAVKETDGKNYLFIKESEGVFKDVLVTAGERNDYYSEVSGIDIKEGTEIKAYADSNYNDNSSSNIKVEQGGVSIDTEIQ